MKCCAHAVDKISMSVTERAKFKCRSDGRLAFSLVSISFVLQNIGGTMLNGQLPLSDIENLRDIL